MNNDQSLGVPYLYKHEIWQATLRNAHPLSKSEELYKIGACLLSQSDLGTLERHSYQKTDPFDYDILVTLENELGGTESQKTVRDSETITLHVCCIYEDSVILKGTAQNLSFSKVNRFL